jgi:hypothetical protein
MNLREKFLKNNTLKQEETTFLGEKVIVKELTGEQRDAFESSLSKIVGKTVHQNLKNVRAKLVIKSLYDLEGNKIFEDADLDSVGNLSASELDKVFAIAQKISGLSNSDIDDLAGNS